MSLLTFKGGVHPNDGKALAKDKAIVQVQPKGDLVYPMSQHIGAPAVPIVAKGDDCGSRWFCISANLRISFWNRKSY